MSTVLTELLERKQLYLDAERLVLTTSQSWTSPDGVTYTKANLSHLRREIEKINAKEGALSGSVGMQSFTIGGRR